MPKTSVSDVQKVQTFSGKKAPGPLLYHAPKGNSTPPKWRVVRGASQLNWDTWRVFILAEIRVQIVNNSCNTCSFTPKEFGLYYFKEPSYFWNQISLLFLM